jgi:hypothetical protein
MSWRALEELPKRFRPGPARVRRMVLDGETEMASLAR